MANLILPPYVTSGLISCSYPVGTPQGSLRAVWLDAARLTAVRAGTDEAGEQPNQRAYDKASFGELRTQDPSLDASVSFWTPKATTVFGITANSRSRALEGGGHYLEGLFERGAI